MSFSAPMSIKLEPAGGKIAKGGTLTLKAIVERNPAFAGPVTVTLQNLPAGITSPPVTIAADQTSADVILTATADVAASTVNNLTAKAEGMSGKAKLEVASPAVTLAVE